MCLPYKGEDLSLIPSACMECESWNPRAGQVHTDGSLRLVDQPVQLDWEAPGTVKRLYLKQNETTIVTPKVDL